jgi:zinc protease
MKSFGWLIALLTFGSVAAPPRAVVAAAESQTILRATLDNGLKVVIVRNPLAPVASLVMNYRVGSNEAPPGFPGMAHAQEHMMFRGSPGLSAAQLSDISASMGGDFDADTRQSLTQYFFTVPSRYVDVALHIESVRMRGVLDAERLWDQERGAIEQEVAQDLSNPQYVFYTRLLKAMFAGTPYAHDALGTRSSFDRTTGAMLKDFHDTWYAPNNAILVIVGDVEPAAVLKTVKELFGDMPRKKLPERPEVHLEPVQAKTLHLDTDLPYGMAVAAFRMPGLESADFAAAQVLADVLSSERGSLYALVPEGKALGTDFSLDGLPGAGLGYAMAAFPEGADSSRLLEELHSVLEEVAKKGVPPDLVEAAKRRERAGLEFQKNSISGLAMAWSDALAREGRSSPEDDIRAIERVRPEDVNRVARGVLDWDHAIRAVLTPHASGKPVSARGFGGRESFAPTQATPVSLPDWAKGSLSELSVPPPAASPVVSTLPNGIRLIVQPESVSHTVSVFGAIENKPDLQTPPGKEGVSEALDRLFSYGTTTLDRVGFQKALDDVAADESAGTRFSVQVLTEYFERGVELLADNQLHPALPQKAFETIRTQLAGEVAGELRSPGYLTDHALESALLPAGDPSLRHATPATVGSLRLQDVKDYYRSVFRPDMTVIVVIGDVSPDKARTVIERYFGGWTAEGPRPNVKLPPVPANKPATVAVPNTSRVQDEVTLAETLGLVRSNPDYYALELANQVLGGGFYASRLYRDLREKAGLAYYVSTSFDVGETRSFYTVTYGCDPPNVAKARAIIERDLDALRARSVSDIELRRAKTLLVRQVPLSQSSLDSIAGGLLHRAIHHLPLDEPTRAARRYLALTAADVRDAFARWVRPADLVQVVQGPTPH